MTWTATTSHTSTTWRSTSIYLILWQTIIINTWHTLTVNPRITFKLACLTYKLLTTGQPAYLCTILHHYTQTRTLRSTNQFFLDAPWFSTVKDRLVTGLLQSGMDYLLISDIHPLSTRSNAVWKLTFWNSPSTPLPCCPPSDCQRLWFSTTVIIACNNNNKCKKTAVYTQVNSE